MDSSNRKACKYDTVSLYMRPAPFNEKRAKAVDACIAERSSILREALRRQVGHLRCHRTSMEANARLAFSDETSDQGASARNPILSSDHGEHVLRPAMQTQNMMYMMNNQIRHVVISWKQYLLGRNRNVSVAKPSADPHNAIHVQARFELVELTFFRQVSTGRQHVIFLTIN